MLHLLIFAVTLLHVTTGMQWTDQLADHGVLTVCQGQDLPLPWNFTLAPGERVQDVRWRYQAEGREDEILALLLVEQQQLLVMPSFSGRVHWLGTTRAGIVLSQLGVLEAGNYSVHVSTDDAVNPLSNFDKTVNVQVVVPPRAESHPIQMEQNVEVVWDNATRQWRPQLTCRVFSDLGHPALQVVWTTPDSQQSLSSSQDNGNFTLLLPNPAPVGNYSCALSPLSQPTRCLPSSYPLTQEASVHVGGVTLVTSALLEAQQEQTMALVRKDMESLRQEMEARIEAEVQGLKSENVQLRGQVESLRAEKAALESMLQTAGENSSSEEGGPLGPQDVLSQLTALQKQIDANSRRVSFHGRLRNAIISYRGRLHNFTEQLFNEGGGFDPSSGVFTAPVNGTYYLIGVAGTVYSPYTLAYMSLVKDGQRLASTYVLQSSRNRATGSCNAVVRLTVGERVWLESRSPKTAYDYQTTTFSGFLLAADP